MGNVVQFKKCKVSNRALNSEQKGKVLILDKKISNFLFEWIGGNSLVVFREIIQQLGVQFPVTLQKYRQTEKFVSFECLTGGKTLTITIIRNEVLHFQLRSFEEIFFQDVVCSTVQVIDGDNSIRCYLDDCDQEFEMLIVDYGNQGSVLKNIYGGLICSHKISFNEFQVNIVAQFKDVDSKDFFHKVFTNRDKVEKHLLKLIETGRLSTLSAEDVKKDIYILYEQFGFFKGAINYFEVAFCVGMEEECISSIILKEGKIEQLIRTEDDVTYGRYIDGDFVFDSKCAEVIFFKERELGIRFKNRKNIIPSNVEEIITLAKRKKIEILKQIKSLNRTHKKGDK